MVSLNFDLVKSFGCKSAMDQVSRSEVVAILLRVTIGATVSYFALKWLMNQIDPTMQSKKKARTKAEMLIKRLTDSDPSLKIDLSTLSDHELVIASHLVVPEDINVSWRDIAGLDSVIQELRENIVMPIRYRYMPSSRLWRAPTGVLLVNLNFEIHFFSLEISLSTFSILIVQC